MVDAQALDPPGADLLDDPAMREREDLRVVLADADEAADVEEAAVDNGIGRVPPVAHLPVLLGEQPIENVSGQHLFAVRQPARQVGGAQGIILLVDAQAGVLPRAAEDDVAGAQKLRRRAVQHCEMERSR